MNNLDNRKNLLILGNGFDLSLGYKSSYSDYINSSVFSALFDRYFVNEKEMQLYSYLRQREGELKNWIDVENELANVASKNLSYLSNDAFEKLKINLKSYIMEIDNSTFLNQESAAFKLIQDSYRPGLTRIITFNYTDSVYKAIKMAFPNLEREKIEKDIIYCHLNAKQSNSIVFGVQDGVYLNGHAYLRKSLNSFYKHRNLLSRELIECRSVDFFGHSLGVTDDDYFKEFFSAVLADPNPIGFVFTFHHFKKSGKIDVLNKIDYFYNSSPSQFVYKVNVNYVECI